MSITAPSPIPSSAVELVLGPLFIGTILAAILWGIANVQYFIFLTNGSSERPMVRLLLGMLWITDTFHLVCAIQSCYSSMILNAKSPEAPLPWGVPGVFIASVLTVALVDGLYIYRIWILTRRTLWIACISVDVFIACGFLLAYAISLSDEKLYTAVDMFFVNVCFYPGTALLAIGDLSIAITLCYFLYRSKPMERSRTRFAVHFFLSYTINTGLATSILTVSIIATGSTNSISLGLGLVANGLYVNSLMGALNAREKFRNADNIVFMQNISAIADDPESQRPRFETRPAANSRVVISVQKSELKAEL